MQLHQLSDLRHLIDQFVRDHSCYDPSAEIVDFHPNQASTTDLIQFAERVREISEPPIKEFCDFDSFLRALESRAIVARDKLAKIRELSDAKV